MNLQNGITRTSEKVIIQDINSGWYVSDRHFGDGVLRHLSFTPNKKHADSFDPKSIAYMDVVGSNMDSPFNLKLIKLTKTIVEFENEEEVK